MKILIILFISLFNCIQTILNTLIYGLNFHFNEARSNIENKLDNMDTIEEFYQEWNKAYDSAFEIYDINVKALRIDKSNQDLLINNRLKLESLAIKEFSNKYSKLIIQKREDIEKDIPNYIDHLIWESKSFNLNNDEVIDLQIAKFGLFNPKNMDDKFSLKHVYNEQKSLLEEAIKTKLRRYNLISLNYKLM